MFLVIGLSFVPLIGFSILGIIIIIFTKAILNIKHFHGSMKGSILDNNLEFRKSAIIITRIAGIIFILLGIAIFSLINGWLDSILNIS